MITALGAAVALSIGVFAAQANAAAWVSAGSLTANGGGGSLAGPSGVAVDQVTGELYVTNFFGPSLAAADVLKFDRDGTPASPASIGAGNFSGVAVDPGTDHVYGLSDSKLFNPSGETAIKLYTAAGASVGTDIPVTGLHNGEGGRFNQIATDSEGDVYYPSGAGDVVQVFEADGTALPPIEGSGENAFNNPHSVAIDDADNVYVADSAEAVDEKQVITKDATGGTFKLSFEGQTTGATGTGDTSFATGIGDLNGASGTGIVTKDSDEITEVEATAGAFEVGQTITGTGIPSSTTITAIVGETLTISKLATSTGATPRPLTAGLTMVTNVETESGAFEVGQTITGTGIQSNTKVSAIGAGTLTLSKVSNSTGTDVALTAASREISNVETATGAFTDGQTISGPGIPSGTTISDVDDEAETITLSADPTAAGTAISLTSDIGFDADANTVRQALTALSTIGDGNLNAKGSDGGPWTVTFVGDFAVTDVPQITADGSGLSGGEAEVTVETTANGSFTPGHVYKFDNTGALDSVLMTGDSDPASTQPSGLGVNPVTGEVFVVQGHGTATQVVAYDSAGAELGEFGEGEFSSALSYFYAQVAVDADTGRVYVSDPGGVQVQLYDPLPAPNVATGTASAITKTGAKLNATVNAEGLEADCEFLYDADPELESPESVPCTPNPVIGSTDTPVFANLTGLDPNTTYHFRVLAENEGGSSGGEAQQFTTLAEAPLASTGAASGVGQDRVTLNATVNANGDDAACEFEYGTTTGYGQSAPCSIDPVTGEGEVSVSAAIGGLAASTTYHYRVVAANNGGESNGQDATFTTAAAPAPPAPPAPPPAAPVIPAEPPKQGNKTNNKAKRLKRCIVNARKAHRKARKRAKSKRGKARARAMKTANKRKAKQMRKCRKRFGGKRAKKRAQKRRAAERKAKRRNGRR